MKKLTVLLFALASANSSFSMLSNKILNCKNIKSFPQKRNLFKATLDHCPCFAKDCTCGEKRSKNEPIVLANNHFKSPKEEIKELKEYNIKINTHE